MYLQDTARSGAPSAGNEKAAGATTARHKPDISLRIGVALLLASGVVLGVINLLVMIRLVAVALGA